MPVMQANFSPADSVYEKLLKYAVFMVLVLSISFTFSFHTQA